MSAGVPLVQCDDQYRAPVHVSAGGTLYTTTLTTLTRFPGSKLAKLFNGSLPIPLDPINHHYFLDTDGTVFAHILNFLRYGELVLPEHFDQLPLLLKQAQELEIWPLCEELKNLSEGEKEEDRSDINEAKRKIQLKKTKRQRRNKRKLEMREDIHNLLKILGEGFQQLIAELEQKIEKINTQERSQEDEKTDNLVAKLGAGIQRLIIDGESKITTIVNETEHKRQKEDEQRDNLMKSLEDGFQRMLVDSEDRVERIFKIQEQRQIQQPVKSSGQPAGVIIVNIGYHNVGTKEKPSYNIVIMSYPDNVPQLTETNEVNIKSTGDPQYSIWTYQDVRLRCWLIANISSKLVNLGYQLVTAAECINNNESQCPSFREYVFVRS